MARIRSIKPELHSSRSLASCSRDARWVFVGLFTLADDEGRLHDLPKQIAGALFPHEDDVTASMVAGWIDELVQADCVRRYEIDGRRYLHLPGWRDHQKISKATPSRIPDPPANPPGNPGQSGETHGELGSLKLEVRSLNGHAASNGKDDSAGITPKLTSLPAGRDRCLESYEEHFELIWRDYPRKMKKPVALRAYIATRRRGADPAELAMAVKHFAEAMSPRAPANISHGSTFFGPDELWTDYVDGVPAGDSPLRPAASSGFVDPEVTW